MNTNTTIEEITKEIESGKYSDCYLIYNRKSTDEPNNQKNSIKYQRAENTRFASNQRLSLAQLTFEGFCRDGIVSERHSCFKEDIELAFGDGNTVKYRIERPKFFRLVQWLNKGYFKGVIYLCWDRASRNKGDETIIRKLMKAGVDTRFALATYDKTSSGELHMDIDGMFAAHHSRVTSEKVSLTFRNSRERGLWTHKAGVGYLNKGTMEHKPKDPIRAPIIFQLAELAATGEWSLADLARWAIEQNFTMPPMRRRRTSEEVLTDEENDERVEIEKISRLPTFNNIHKILTSRFYTGKILTKEGQWIPSNSHEAIIPEELFDRVQEKLRERNKSAHYQQVLDHPLRGMIRCGVCRRVYTPYPKKGIMYYGARCNKTCANSNNHFNIKFITDKIGELVVNLSFTDDEFEKLDARSGTEIALLEAKRMSQLEQGERKKKKIREDLAYLNANRLTLLKTGAYTPEGIAAEEAKLTVELSLLQNMEKASDVAMSETVRDVVRLSELLENVYFCYKNGTSHEKEIIIKEIFSELAVNEDTLEYKCKKGFEPLSQRFLPNYDPTENRTPLPSLRRMCPSR